MLARVIEDTIVEVLRPIDGFTLNDSFSKELLDLCTEVPNDAEAGWVLVDGTWQAPAGE